MKLTKPKNPPDYDYYKIMRKHVHDRRLYLFTLTRKLYPLPELYCS